MTIEDHFKILPQPYQDLAFANAKDIFSEVSTIHEAICSAFEWSETPEGFDFWLKVAMHYLVDSELPEIKR